MKSSRPTIGQRLLDGPTDPNMRGDGGGGESFEREIVGVVGDAKQTSVTDQGLMETYVPYRQCGVRFSMVAVRSTGDPLQLVPAIQREIVAEEKDLPISDVKTMAQRAAGLTAQSRVGTAIFSIFAVLALLLSAIGIYGVISYLVSQRTHEIGIRLALGARGADVLRLVIGQGLKLALAGMALGLAAALAMTRLLAHLLFGVSATDPLTFAGVTILLTGAALVACYLPAQRATKVDPIVSLRCE